MNLFIYTEIWFLNIVCEIIYGMLMQLLNELWGQDDELFSYFYLILI